MQFNPLYSSLNSKLFHIQQPSPLRGAKAGHFNLALAEELQWTDEEKKHGLRSVVASGLSQSFHLWQWFMQAINLDNGQVS